MDKDYSEIMHQHEGLIETITTLSDSFMTYSSDGLSSDDLVKYRRAIAGAKRELQELENTILSKIGEWEINE